MKILELFAGSCSFSNVAKELGHETFTSDIEQFGSIDYVCDIMDFDVNKVPFVPDIIWCSIPCTTFSVASIGTYWTGGKGAYVPKNDKSKEGLLIAKKAVEIIEWYVTLPTPCDHLVLFYIENPRGLLRKLGVIKDGFRKEVTYCSYDDKRMKPTDIWTNNFNWIPRNKCKNYKYDNEGNIINKHCHHESARAGSKTGTQGLKNAYERSKVPRELCLEILEASK